MTKELRTQNKQMHTTESKKKVYAACNDTELFKNKDNPQTMEMDAQSELSFTSKVSRKIQSYFQNIYFFIEVSPKVTFIDSASIPDYIDECVCLQTYMPTDVLFST